MNNLRNMKRSKKRITRIGSLTGGLSMYPSRYRLNNMDRLLDLNLRKKIDKSVKQNLQLSLEIAKLAYKQAKVRQKMNDYMTERESLRR